jgi:hypothetical protein
MSEALGVVEHRNDCRRHAEYADILRGWHRHRQGDLLRILQLSGVRDRPTISRARSTGQEAAPSSQAGATPEADDGADFVACAQASTDCDFNRAAPHPADPSSAA